MLQSPLLFFIFFSLLCYFSSYCCLISNVNTLRSSVRHTDNRLMEIWREKNGAIQWKILIICLQIYTHFRRGVCLCVCVCILFQCFYWLAMLLKHIEIGVGLEFPEWLCIRNGIRQYHTDYTCTWGGCIEVPFLNTVQLFTHYLN